ncbi:MAG: efflux RND transporter periplasmic adaptor subunit [Geminicoccaceae bacterium]
MTRIKTLAAILLLASAPVVAEPSVKPVKLMKVTTGDGGLTRQFFGEVVARETVDLAFRVGGQIVDFPVIEGEEILKGSLIARLDLVDLERAVEESRLNKKQADRTADRLNRLSGNAVSQVAIEDATTEAGLADIALRNAEQNLDYATLQAPFDALVASRNIANFSMVSSGTSVVRLHDMSDLRIEIDVPEILFQRAGEDPDVEIFGKFPSDDRTFPLEVREFNAEAATIGQTYRLTLGMNKPEGLRVLPGSSVTVSALIRNDRDAMRLPAAATVIDTDGSVSVMVFSPTNEDQGSLIKTMVELEPAADGGFLVLSGLEEGDEIVSAGAAVLEDGQTVRRFSGFPK